MEHTEQEILETSPSVTLCISNAIGVLHLAVVGGYALSNLLREIAAVGDYPLKTQDSQLDVIGQDIYVTVDHNMFKFIKGCFTCLSWESVKQLPDLANKDSVVYSFVVSY
tara:strand:- start:69 stop:398 length:330 start_codon:yes stop_codon:yes gene_type:complete